MRRPERRGTGTTARHANRLPVLTLAAGGGAHHRCWAERPRGSAGRRAHHGTARPASVIRRPPGERCGRLPERGAYGPSDGACAVFGPDGPLATTPGTAPADLNSHRSASPPHDLM
ncbi:hypothetical protein [Streptomyces sp. CT34]|uniref:hypothetical protein n=1 Tax=Streptomyces sp. CT34 TaxID=1553907 RepID=UPI0005B93A43|nr:hypothetical protein [Streptomyces sp. CT34]